MKPTLLLAALLACAGSARPLAAQDERAQVLATVQKLFDGMRTKDTALMRSAFLPGAKLVGMRTRQDGTAYVQQLTDMQFAEFAARDTRAAWTERAFDPEVRIEGTLATVWAPYEFRFGDQMSHCGVDAVQLLRTADGWKIVSLADTFQREGCPQRPAP